MVSDAILALNAGSSSIKFALARVEGGSQGTRVATGEIESVDNTPRFAAKDGNGQALANETWSDVPVHGFHELLERLLAWVEDHLGPDRLVAAGHRIVHGGSAFRKPTRFSAPVLTALRALAPLAPLHQERSLQPVDGLLALRPSLPQYACFDTAFHATLPAVAARFALPRRFEETGVRRYGFHGLSYEHVAWALPHVAPALAHGRVVVAHLGNGASLCAMRDGRSIDTTMGFTALDGLVMGTRCGSLDPGVVLYMLEHEGMTPTEISDVLYHRSGLLGVSGRSGDMRALLASDDADARAAVELFVYRVVRETAALAGALGGLDGVVFTGGIGEHAPRIRDAVCAGLAFLRPFEVHVVPADEEAVIIRHVLDERLEGR